MIPKALDQIDKTEIERLVTERVPEGRTLDYKRDLSLRTDDHKKELARDVSSFANAAGGDLVFGLEEAKDESGANLGYPGKVVGVECANFDATKQRIESILRDTLDPRIVGVAIEQIGDFERGPVIIVRVPRSWNAPHMVTFSNQTHFYSRNGSGKHPLDVREIRAAFMGSAERELHVRRFRDERLGRLVAREMPVRVTVESDALVVIHVVPVDHYAQRAVDVRALRNDRRLQPPGSGGWSHRFNLDGVVAYSENYSYLQAFRSGAFEAVWSQRIFEENGCRYVSPFPTEKLAAEVVGSCAALLRDAGVLDPLSVHLTLMGAKGVRIWNRDMEQPWDRDVTVDRDPLILPDVLIEGAGDCTTTLKPLFDALWQSSGWDRSYGYDANGNWDPTKH